jgi:hypothetical protein
MEGNSTNSQIRLSEDNDSERKRIYEEFRNHLLKLQMMNSENFDKSILSLSSTLLALSLAFINDIVDFKKAINTEFIKLSWVFLVGAILITLISFILSQKAIDKQLDYAEKYYLSKLDEYLNKNNIYNSLTKGSSYFSALFFIVGIILTVLFVQSNI